MEFKTGGYYYQKNKWISETFKDKYAIYKVIEVLDDDIKFIIINHGEKIGILNKSFLKDLKEIEPIIDLFRKLCFKDCNKDIYTKLEKFTHKLYENDRHTIIHLIAKYNDKNKCFMGYNQFYILQKFRNFESIEDLEKNGEKFKTTEDLFKILNNNGYEIKPDEIMKSLDLCPNIK